MLKAIKKLLIGKPIPSYAANQEHLTKVRALPVFASDALSSVAYATEEIILVLIAAGTIAFSYSVPIATAIVVLLALVVFSYRQTIHEYPSGGGSYVVAKDNLGQSAGLVAGASLMIDYILTVAVSVSAGTGAITSAFPSLAGHNVQLALVAIAVLTLANLRGVRESAKIFMLPTYAFVISCFALLIVGYGQFFFLGFHITAPPTVSEPSALSLFLILHAFSSGCTAMTGIEAVSNGVPAFQKPQARNASLTLLAMTVILITIFMGITFLTYINGIVPQAHETVLSQLARLVFGKGFMYFVLQFTTMGILLLAANTSFAGFPGISSFLARDRFLPRQLGSQGDRLVFSNGILLLGFLSAFLIWIFQANTHALIPLYAVGVFLCFTLSQTGMVAHWVRRKNAKWLKHAVVNGVGALATAMVTVIFIVTKFSHGAWLIAVLIPALYFLFTSINRHYLRVGKQLSLEGSDLSEFKTPPKHTVVVPLSGLHRGVLEALRYARSISHNVRAVYIEIDPAQTKLLLKAWKEYGQKIQLDIRHSQYRSVIAPLLEYIEELDEKDPDDIVTVVIPEFVTGRWWQGLLHNQTALLIRAALAFKRNKVVTTVRYHLN